MKKENFFKCAVLATALTLGSYAYAEESTIEKAEAVTDSAVDSIKNTYRGAKDNTCEMINGKLECLGKKLKNKALKLKDKAVTKANETKNKID